MPNELSATTGTPAEIDRHQFAQTCLEVCRQHAAEPLPEKIADGTGGIEYRELAHRARFLAEIRGEAGADTTWAELLTTQTCETLASQNDDQLAARLTQTAATCIAWATQIRQRKNNPK